MCSATQAQTRIRALEMQIAAEVANAALTVQSNLKRVEAATAARELAQKRLEAEQSKFDVGMTTNFFVVQAQRDLRDARTPSCARWRITASRSSTSSARSSRRRAAAAANFARPRSNRIRIQYGFVEGQRRKGLCANL